MPIDRTDRPDGRTDTRPLHRPCTAYYAGSVDNSGWLFSAAGGKCLLVHLCDRLTGTPLLLLWDILSLLPDTVIWDNNETFVCACVRVSVCLSVRNNELYNKEALLLQTRRHVSALRPWHWPRSTRELGAERRKSRGLRWDQENMYWGRRDQPLPWEKGSRVGRVLGISGVRSTVSALLARWQHNITYSFNQNCQTAGVHENKTIFRPSSIKVNKHNRTF